MKKGTPLAKSAAVVGLVLTVVVFFSPTAAVGWVVSRVLASYGIAAPWWECALAFFVLYVTVRRTWCRLRGHPSPPFSSVLDTAGRLYRDA